MSWEGGREGVGCDVRLGSIAPRYVLLVDAVAVGVGWAVVVASQDVGALLAHAAPVVGAASLEL